MLISSSFRLTSRPSQYGQIGRSANFALVTLVVNPQAWHCRRLAMRSRTVSSETSSQIARASCVCNRSKIRCKLSACGMVRGKPSKTKPWPPCRRSQSSIKPTIILSETSPPCCVVSAVSKPSGVPRSLSRRNIAPGEVTGIPNWRVIISACVPLPEPGAPNNTSRRFT